jgi:hypothetical protein
MLLENVVIDDSNIIMNIEHGYDTDIEYLNSNNTDIQKILKKKDTAPGKIIDISQILNKNTHI